MLHGHDTRQHGWALLPGHAMGIRVQQEYGMVQAASVRFHAAGIEPLRRHGQKYFQGFAILGVDLKHILLFRLPDPGASLVLSDTEGGQIILRLGAVIPAAARPERGGIL